MANLRAVLPILRRARQDTRSVEIVEAIDHLVAYITGPTPVVVAVPSVFRAEPVAENVAKPVAKPPATGDVAKPRKGGRPRIADKPLTAAERMRRSREAKRNGQAG